jgi:hypothetical protein
VEITVHSEACEVEGELVSVTWDQVPAHIVLVLSDKTEIRVRWTEWLRLKDKVGQAINA